MLGRCAATVQCHRMAVSGPLHSWLESGVLCAADTTCSGSGEGVLSIPDSSPVGLP